MRFSPFTVATRYHTLPLATRPSGSTIRSTLLQGYPELHLIVVMDPSGEACRETIDRYRPWVTCISDEQITGYYRAIDEAFAHSTGTVMTWLEPGDLYTPNSFWAVGSIFATRGDTVHWLTGASAELDAEGQLAAVYDPPNVSGSLARAGCYDGVMLPSLQQPGTFWSRALWDAAGARLDTSLTAAADFELWCRFADNAELFAASVPLAGTRPRASNIGRAARQTYLDEVDASRAARNSVLALSRRSRLSRTIVQQLVRAIQRMQPPRNFATYDLLGQRWWAH